MAKVELHVPKDLGLTKKQLDVLKKSFKRQLVDGIKARRAKQMAVDIRAKAISEEVKVRPPDSD